MPRKYSNIMDDLDNRIRRYYVVLNEGPSLSAYAFLDVDLFEDFCDNSQMELHAQLVESFRRVTGKITVLQVVMDVHLGENLSVYKGRDYAMGRTKWRDEKGVIHFFSERWVKGKHCWFTLNVTPRK